MIRSSIEEKFAKRHWERLHRAKCISGLFVITLLLLCSTEGRAQDSPTLEERLQRMEQEIQLLKQRNAILEEEVEKLHERADANEGMGIGATAEAASQTSQPKPQMQIAYKRGLVFSSPDNDFKLKVGGRVTTRVTAFESGHPSDEDLSVERARLYANATLLDLYDLRIQTEFAKDPKLKDGYINIRHLPKAQLRLGQFKPPYAWENLQSHKYLDFADRSIAVNNIRNPSRDIGAMLHGKLCDGRLGYQLAVLNGSGENTGDDNGAKDIAGRLTLDPFRGREGTILSGLHLGISGTYGDQAKDFSGQTFKTIGGTTFIDFVDDTAHTGDRIRFGTEAGLAAGPASIKAEWTRMELEGLELATEKEDIDISAWYVSGSYILTGEEKTFGRLSPAQPLDPSNGAWGAWELAARYSVFDADSDLFGLGMAEGTDRAEAFTVGLNWYLNDSFRVIFDYERTDFDDDVEVDGEMIDNEDAFLMRCQLEF